MIPFINSINTSNKPKLSQTDLVVIVDGDSIVRSQHGGGGEQYWPTNLIAWLTTLCNSVEGYSFGVGGQTIDNMNADADTQIDILVDNSKTNLIIAWEDANALGLIGGQSAVDCLAANQLYHSNRKAAGWDYSIMLKTYWQRTPYPNPSGMTTPSNLAEYRSYYNDLLPNLDQSIQPWDAYIDLSEAPNIGGVEGQSQNPTYWTDHIHLTNAGYDILEQQVRNAILTIFDL